MIKRQLLVLAAYFCFRPRISSGFRASHKSTSAAQSIHTKQAKRVQLIRIASYFSMPTKQTAWPSIKFKDLNVAAQMTKSEDDLAQNADIDYTNGTTDAVMSTRINGDVATSEVQMKPAMTQNIGSKHGSNSSGFSLILIPILLFKLSIVMVVKFAKDVVIFPTLYFYRIVQLGKQKIMAGLSKKAKLWNEKPDLKVNGEK